MKSEHTTATKSKSSTSSRRTAKGATSSRVNKREFVKNLLKPTATIVWPREMKIVKQLFEIFPDQLFWNSLKLNFKLNSLCWLLSDKGREFLNTEYKKYKLELPEEKVYTEDQKNVVFESKSEYDTKSPLNLREFLNLWQKKT